MTYGDMHWQQRLDLMNASGLDPNTSDPASFNPGMALDTATMPWSGATPQQQTDLQKLVDQNAELKTALAMKNTPGGNMTQDVFKFLKGVGEVVSIGDPVFKALAYPYKKLSTNVIDPVLQAQGLAFNRDWQRQNGTANPFSTFFDWDTWHHAQDLSKTESLGRRYVKNMEMVGNWIQHPDQIGQWSDAADKMSAHGAAFTAMSGTADAAGTFFLDPLMAFGKATKAARVLKTTSQVNRVIRRSGGDFDQIMASDGVMRFMRWSDGKNARQIAEHQYIRHSRQSGQIADLMANSSLADKQLILRLGWGDLKAREELQATAPAVLREWQRLKGDVQFNSSAVQVGPKLPKSLQAMRLAESQKLLETYGNNNRTLLKLAQTEHFDEPLTHTPPPGTPSPFAQMYADSGSPLFTSSTWRPPIEAAAGMKHLAEAQQAARVLANKDFPNGINGAFYELEAKMPSVSKMAKGVTSPSGAKRADLAKTGAAYQAKESRYPKVKFWTSDQLAAATGKTKVPTGAEFTQSGTRRVRQPDGTYKEVLDQSRDKAITVGKATQTSLMSKMLDSQGNPVNNLDRLTNMAGMHEDDLLKARRYFGAQSMPLWKYNPTAVDEHAADMAGQLDLANYNNGDELRQLEAKWGYIKELQDKAETLANLPGTSGIYNQLSLMPKTGPKTLGKYSDAYSRIAERSAARRYNGVANSSRVVRYGWYALPVKVVMASGRALSRGIHDTGTPMSYNPNDPESWRSMDAWLSKVKGYPSDKRITVVNDLMGMTNEGDKLKHVEAIEADVLKHIMERNHIGDENMLQEIIAKTLGKRKAVMDQLSANVDAYKAGNTDLKVNWMDGDGSAVIVHPHLATQLLNEHPLMPINELELAMSRNRHWLRSSGVAIKDPVMDFGTMIHRAWKLSVLGHFGYMPRTLSDEVLVSMAALGGISIAHKGAEGMFNYARNIGTHTGNTVKRVGNIKSKLNADAQLKYAYKTPKHRIGEDITVANGVPFRGMYQGPRADIWRGFTGVEQRASFELEAKNLEHLRTSNNYGELHPTNVESHLPAWAHALNNQLGRDELAQKVLQGMDNKGAVRWLTQSPRGMQYAARNKVMAGNESEWVKDVEHHVFEYTTGSPELAAKAAARKVTRADLEAIPMDQRPQVHGGQLDYALGANDWQSRMNDIMDGFYHVANELPTNTLVRHPVADLYYHKRLRELVASARAQGMDPRLHPERLYQMEEIARGWTVKQMQNLFKDHLFNSPQSALKFVFPFFGAWRGSLARWAHMIGEDPSTVSRINQAWQGLGKSSELQDSNGDPVDPNKPHGFSTDAQMVVRLPKALLKQLGYAGVAPARRINLKTFNTILQGDPWWNPGYGPAVTIPLSELIKGDIPGLGGAKPYLADNPLVKQALPFGARNLTELAAPAPWQRVISALSGDSEGNSAMDSTKINIIKMEMTRYMRGDRKDKPGAEEINSKAKHLMWLRAAESWFSPVSTKPVIYGTDKAGNPWPKGWQFLADKFRAYRSSTPNADGKIDGRAGEDKFFQEFPEAWIYMQSTSKNYSGIPANQASWDKSERVKELMTKAPDIFASVAGITNQDKNGFNRGVYDAQMNSSFNPATGDNMRGTTNTATFMTDAQVNEGWRLYAKMMDTNRNVEKERGLDPLYDATPDDIQAAKKQYVSFLKQQYPEWGDAYDGGSSTGKMRKILEQANTIVNDPRMQADKTRHDITMLSNYLGVREWVVGQLKERKRAGGSAVLGANSNEGLLRSWEGIRKQMAHDDTKFSELWMDRYFANDYIQEVK